MFIYHCLPITLQSQNLPDIGVRKQPGSWCMFMRILPQSAIKTNTHLFLRGSKRSYILIPYINQVKALKEETTLCLCTSHPLKLHTTNLKEELKVAEKKLWTTSCKEALLLKRSSCWDLIVIDLYYFSFLFLQCCFFIVLCNVLLFLHGLVI